MAGPRDQLGCKVFNAVACLFACVSISEHGLAGGKAGLFIGIIKSFSVSSQANAVGAADLRAVIS